MSSPDETVQLSELPAEVRERILAEREARKPKVLSPVSHLEHSANFATRDIKELTEKVTELIDQHNLVVRALTKESK